MSITATDRTATDRSASGRTVTDGSATDRSASGRTVTEKTGARTDEAAALIAGARDRIDVLDDRIIGLIQERMAVSAVIQESRIASGGRRVNLNREMEVLAHFRDALGRPGTALAMTMLELCRGRI
ncbi:chorismate mutase [Streptomyces sp. NPDC048416]|uniref:chorismate mutase n=1 Tax=Streptomyces sp. NPDC048416 TaxID=3365546 RepID=UPI0037107B2F